MLLSLHVGSVICGPLSGASSGTIRAEAATSPRTRDESRPHVAASSCGDVCLGKATSVPNSQASNRLAVFLAGATMPGREGAAAPTCTRHPISPGRGYGHVAETIVTLVTFSVCGFIDPMSCAPADSLAVAGLSVRGGSVELGALALTSLPVWALILSSVPVTVTLWLRCALRLTVESAFSRYLPATLALEALDVVEADPVPCCTLVST